MSGVPESSHRIGKNGLSYHSIKRKVTRQECENYRDITLLFCPGKLFARVLLPRMKNLLLAKRRNEQSGYTPGRSTVDRMFTSFTLLQTRREYNRSLWIAYVDLKRAFDSHRSLACIDKSQRSQENCWPHERTIF